MTHYVVAFAFDDQGQVALIKKNKPDWQRGLLNGIGGKVEPGEISVEAMVREFQEETGVLVQPSQWMLRGVMYDKPDIVVDVYTVKLPVIGRVTTVEEELVALYNPTHLIANRCIANVPALVELCRMGVTQFHNSIPSFVLQY